MILLVRPDASEQTVAALVRSIEALGLEARPLGEGPDRAFEVVGAERGRVLALGGAPGVEAILTRRRPLAEGEPVWPHFALRLLILLILLVALLTLLTAFFPPGLGDPAESFDPGSGRVEWYLRPLDSFLGLFPGSLRWLGGVLVLLSWLALLAWPFLDRVDESGPSGRRAVRIMRLMGILIVVFVVVLGLA